MPATESEHEAILDAVRQRAGPMLREILRQHHRSGWVVARAFLEGDAQRLAVTAAPMRRPRSVRSSER